MPIKVNILSPVIVFSSLVNAISNFDASYNLSG